MAVPVQMQRHYGLRSPSDSTPAVLKASGRAACLPCALAAAHARHLTCPLTPRTPAFQYLTPHRYGRPLLTHNTSKNKTTTVCYRSQLAGLARCLERDPPDLETAEELADAVLLRHLSACINLAADVPVYVSKAKGGPVLGGGAKGRLKVGRRQ